MDNNPLTPSELDHLAEVREVCNLVNTPGWHRVLKQMKAFTDEAHEDMIGAVYATAEIKAALQNRWQQRISMLRGVESYIKACEEEKQQLLLEANRDNSLRRTEEIGDWETVAQA